MSSLEEVSKKNDELIIKLIDEDTIYGPMTITNVNKTKIPSFANNPKIY